MSERRGQEQAPKIQRPARVDPENPTVTVMVSKELLADLEHWSPPVQVKIERVDYGTGWELTGRSVPDSRRRL